MCDNKWRLPSQPPSLPFITVHEQRSSREHSRHRNKAPVVCEYLAEHYRGAASICVSPSPGSECWVQRGLRQDYDGEHEGGV